MLEKCYLNITIRADQECRGAARHQMIIEEYDSLTEKNVM